MKTKPTEEVKCEVCGARCDRFASTLCDSICRRAKIAGRSRARQVTFEVKAFLAESWGPSEPPANECSYIEGNNYNQPYLAVG